MQESESLSGRRKVRIVPSVRVASENIGISELLLQTQVWMMVWVRACSLLNFLKPTSHYLRQDAPFCSLGCFWPGSIFLFQSVAKHEFWFLEWVHVFPSCGTCLKTLFYSWTFLGKTVPFRKAPVSAGNVNRGSGVNSPFSVSFWKLQQQQSLAPHSGAREAEEAGGSRREISTIIEGNAFLPCKKRDGGW